MRRVVRLVFQRELRMLKRSKNPLVKQVSEHHTEPDGVGCDGSSRNRAGV